MLLKIMDAPSVPGGKALVACDDSGEVLPMQFACELEQVSGESVVVKVSFKIDGKKVRLASE